MYSSQFSDLSHCPAARESRLFLNPLRASFRDNQIGEPEVPKMTKLLLSLHVDIQLITRKGQF